MKSAVLVFPGINRERDAAGEHRDRELSGRAIGMRRVAALGVVLFLSALTSAQAAAAAKPACRIMRMEGAALLQKCDDQLQSFALSMKGTERTAVREHTNKFRFSCRPGFCDGEPEIIGWFIDPDAWTQSKQDEASVFAIVAAQAGWKLLGSEEHFRGIFKPSCELSPVTLAGLPGRMICYEVKSEAAVGLSMVVAADAEVGFLVTFQGLDSKGVERAVSNLSVFDLQRGHGDTALERWLQ
jgi:hypothetical protein